MGTVLSILAAARLREGNTEVVFVWKVWVSCKGCMAVSGAGEIAPISVTSLLGSSGEQGSCQRAAAACEEKVSLPVCHQQLWQEEKAFTLGSFLKRGSC